jgi:hypothetical protein
MTRIPTTGDTKTNISSGATMSIALRSASVLFRVGERERHHSIIGGPVKQARELRERERRASHARQRRRA